MYITKNAELFNKIREFFIIYKQLFYLLFLIIF